MEYYQTYYVIISQMDMSFEGPVKLRLFGSWW